MTVVAEFLAVCGLCAIFRSVSDNFFWGWFGGACAAELLFWTDKVSA
jgi:hypothetical protein